MNMAEYNTLKYLFTAVCIISQITKRVNSSCTGNTCPEHCRCTKTEVHCRGQSLFAVPDSVPQNTTHLAFRHTNISQLNNTSFANCTHLQSLYIGFNNVPLRVENETFSSVPLLKSLRLTNCGIDMSNYSDLPPGIFDTLGALQQLYINDNSFQGATGYRLDLLRNKHKLTTLSLDGIDRIPLPRTFRKLTALKSLLLYGNTTVLCNDTFENLRDSNLSELHIRSRTLVDIELMTFAPLKSLTVLVLDDNNKFGFRKTGERRWHSLQYTNVTRLHLNNVSSEQELNLSVSSLPNSSQANIQELQLSNNHICAISGILGEHLPTIERLYVEYNHLIVPELFDVFNLSSMPELKFLSLNYQDFQWRKSRELKIQLPPKLEELYVIQAFSSAYHSRLDCVHFTGGAPRMQTIDVSQNNINYLKGPLLTDGEPKTIQVLNMSFLHFTKMKNNFMRFAENLTIIEIDMSHSDIGNQLCKDTRGSFMAQFQYLGVEVINFTSSNIKFLFSEFFSQISTLRRIVLKDNAIHVWEPSLVALKSLMLLDLTSNSMLYPSNKFMHDMDELCEQRELTPCDFQLDLLGNPLEFRCYSLDFLKWVYHTKVDLLSKQEYEFYKGPHLITVANFTEQLGLLEIQCSSHYWVLATTCTFAVSLFLLLVATIIFRHRWDIRYFCLRMMRSQKPYKPLREDPDHEFDAFVLYHEDDYPWVRHQLMVHLEQRIHRPFSLCIPDRNWLPGISIEENIISSISHSRKTIVVVSCNAIGDPWFDFALQMTWLRGYDICQEVAVIVALEDVPLDEMSGSLASLRLSHGNREWLEWPSLCNDQQLFWRDLVMALSKPRDRPDRRRFQRSLSRSLSVGAS